MFPVGTVFGFAADAVTEREQRESLRVLRFEVQILQVVWEVVMAAVSVAVVVVSVEGVVVIEVCEGVVGVGVALVQAASKSVGVVV